MGVQDSRAVDEAAGPGRARQDLSQGVPLLLILGVAVGRAMLDLQQSQVKRSHSILHRVMAARLDAALQELVCQHPQRRLVGRTLQGRQHKIRGTKAKIARVH